jgi:hypothetical protein
MTCFKNVNTLKTLLFVLVLFTVGGILITVTEENLDDLFEKPLEVRLGEKHEFDVFPFVSFPGSGNT